MDPENQDRIKALVDRLGADDLVVVLGAADPEALEVAAETVTAGDPSYVGPTGRSPLGLPVVHIFEDEVKEQVDPSIYEEQVGLLELALDTDAVKEAMRKSRAVVTRPRPPGGAVGRCRPPPPSRSHRRVGVG